MTGSWPRSELAKLAQCKLHNILAALFTNQQNGGDSRGCLLRCHESRDGTLQKLSALLWENAGMSICVVTTPCYSDT